MASKRIKSTRITNFTKIYSLANEKKYDIDNLTQKQLVYKQYVAWSYNDSNVAPLSDYMHNPVYQELTSEYENF